MCKGHPFSNAFSNADGYVRSDLNAGELEPQYSNQIRPPANVSELKTTACQERGQEFESSYNHNEMYGSLTYWPRHIFF